MHKPLKERQQSRWEILQDIYIQTGIVPPDLQNPPAIPPLVAHVWECFLQLNRTRQSGFSTNPLSFVEIGAFCALTCRCLERWEVELLLLFDSVFLAVMADDNIETLERLDVQENI